MGIFRLASVNSLRHLRAAVTGLAFGVLPSCATHAAQCSELPKPSLKLLRIDEPITRDNGLSYRSLSNLASRLLQPNGEIVGLTRGNAIVEVATRMITVLDRSTRLECGTPEVVISFGYRPVTVHVAREFPEGSCAHARILEHEMRHVQVYRDHLVRIEPEVARAIQRRLDAWTTERRPPGLTETLLRRDINDEWIPQVRELMGRVEEEQARVDSREEQQRINDSCQGAIRERLRASR